MIHLQKYSLPCKDYDQVSNPDSYIHLITIYRFVGWKNCILLTLKNMGMSLRDFYNTELSHKIQWKNLQKYHDQFCYKKFHLVIC